METVNESVLISESALVLKVMSESTSESVYISESEFVGFMS